MKKYILLMALVLIFAVGCGGRDLSKVKEEFIKNIDASTYLMEGTMTIVSEQDSFSYKVTAARDGDNYRVSLVNELNGHEQIILRTGSEVYVVTPSLNKSFKFQSDWPANGSQAYLIDSLAHDVKNDTEAIIEQTDDGYVITAKVNYPNNANLVNERIHLCENGELKQVEVLDASDNARITVMFNNIDFNPSFDADFFSLESLIDEECCEGEETVSGVLEDVIFPLYVPLNTYLISKDSVNTATGNRVILTFAGESPFTLIEEVARPRTEFEVIPMHGEPLVLSNGVGALTGNSLHWTANNIQYFLSSDSIPVSQLLTIAESMQKTSIPVAGLK